MEVVDVSLTGDPENRDFEDRSHAAVVAGSVCREHPMNPFIAR